MDALQPCAHRGGVDETPPLCIAVVDEQLTLGEAIAARLDAEDDLQIVGVLSSVEPLWTLLDSVPVDLVLLGLPDEIRQEGDSALGAIRRLAERDPKVRLVVMAPRADPSLVAAAIEAGVSGWVPKDLGMDRLLETVRGVRKDETWIPAHVLTGVLNVLVEGNRGGADRASLLSRLTPREMDVLQCIVDGLSRNEIAERLYLSPNTVRTHVQHLLRKLGVHSTLTAAAVARDLGLGRSDSSPHPRLQIDLPGQGTQWSWVGQSPAS